MFGWFMNAVAILGGMIVVVGLLFLLLALVAGLVAFAGWAL